MLIRMPRLQIEDVPDYVIERLQKRADRQGLELSIYVWTLLVRAAEDPDAAEQGLSEEWIARVKSRERTGLTTEDIVAAIREGRGEWPQ